MSGGAWLLLAAVIWLGATVALTDVRWFVRPTLSDRLRRHEARGTTVGPSTTGGDLATAARQVLVPLAREAGDRLATWVGVRDDLATRLERVHRGDDVATFRLHQLGWGLIGALVGVAVAAGIGSPTVGLCCILGGPLLAMLLVEQHLDAASDRHRRRLHLELPVVAEQLGMLLSAGFSLGAALDRIAERGGGAIGADLRRVRSRTRQGLSDLDALREWTAIAGVDALERFVSVLALNHEAGDLGRLISEEARSIRRDVHRERIEEIERRSQQVWIPVTVAALVPGAIFIAIPFVEALDTFGAR